MDPSVSRLRELLPPPAEPTAGTPWAQGEPELGFAFPQDYRDFVDCYGGGQVNGALGVLIPSLRPFWPGGRSGFAGFAQFAAEQIGSAFPDLGGDASAPDPYLEQYRNPHPFYPEPGGLLIWGRGYDGDHCFWLTEDEDPNRWPIVVFFRNLNAPQWRRFDGGMAQFLLSVVDGTYEHADLLVGPTRPACWTRAEDWARRYDG